MQEEWLGNMDGNMSNDVLWTELVRVPENFLEYDIPLLHDMLCAIRSVEAYHDDLYLDDFEAEFKGPVSIEELSDYDDGVDKWLELEPNSSFDEIVAFRGYQWLVKASKWLEVGIPPADRDWETGPLNSASKTSK